MLNALIPKLVGDGAARTTCDRRWHPRLVPPGDLLGIAGVGIRRVRDYRRGVRDCRGDKGETRDRAFHFLEGVLGIVVGLIVFLYPDQAGTAIVLVIGLWAAATGVVEIVSAVRLRREIEDEWLLGLGGVLSIILGSILIVRPQFGQVTTTYVVGTYGLIFGVVLVMLGLRLRRFRPEIIRS